MSEYSKEALWYLRLPKDFFTDYRMRALEGMPNGRLCELLYIKLMCESVSHGGFIRYSEDTAYCPEILAGIVGMSADDVKYGIGVLKALELVEETEGGTIYIPQVESMTIAATKGSAAKAERRRSGGQKVDKCPPSVHQDT